MKRLLLLAMFSTIIAGCSSTAMRVARINNTIDSLRTQFAPDPRTAVFEIRARERNGSIVLYGETDLPAAKTLLLSESEKVAGKTVIDSVETLPERRLGSEIYGIVDVSVGNIYHAPKYASELVSQVLLGHTVRILKEHHGWLFVQSPDRYLGWAQPGAIHRVDSAGLAAYNARRKLIVTSIYSALHTRPAGQGAMISDAVMADFLLPIGKTGASYKVQLPDGRMGYIPAKDVDFLDVYVASHKPAAAGIERVAKMLVGFPYLWGGTSTKGVDCSGFAKTVFRMNDIRLPRDASQQVYVGKRVDPGPDFRNLRTGDLLFFGRKAKDGKPWKIVHVGIYLQNGYFIQSTGRVKISSLVKSDTAFDKYELDHFVVAKRILPSE
ncbi:MAG: C40 family peptidase [Bacteroidetes bacterium]|nr:C40 family peptidase [Bacteroidota bacterium]